ncbi:zf-HC2 domain-containing protein [Nonomuraea sp. B1E8]|uniref:anti-sigma factor family protein n=1 Tax=unclassified Nonomuraea TaxID=2593643 RepID=UPI00325E1844
MTSRVEHTDVGAYALGLLEEDDRFAFEAHLLGCPACRSELADLAGVASVLHGIGPLPEDLRPPSSGDLTGQGDVVGRLRRKKAAHRRQRKGTFAVGMAAAVTLVAGGLTIGTQLSAGEPPVAQGEAENMGPAEQFFAGGTPIEGEGVGGVTGGLVVESKAWGTHAALKLAGVKGPLECELISVGKKGERRVMTGWSVPPAGYGVPGSPDPLYMHGGSATPLKDVDRFEVVTSTGRKLLTIEA